MWHSVKTLEISNGNRIYLNYHWFLLDLFIFTLYTNIIYIRKIWFFLFIYLSISKHFRTLLLLCIFHLFACANTPTHTHCNRFYDGWYQQTLQTPTHPPLHTHTHAHTSNATTRTRKTQTNRTNETLKIKIFPPLQKISKKKNVKKTTKLDTLINYSWWKWKKKINFMEKQKCQHHCRLNNSNGNLSNI